MLSNHILALLKYMLELLKNKLVFNKIKGTPWDEIFSMLSILKIYVKLYSLLILTKNTKKSKNNFKAPKKSEIVVFPGRILPCKQNKSAIFSTLHHIFPLIRR